MAYLPGFVIARVFATCDFAGLRTIISPDHSLLNSVLPQLGQTFSFVNVLHLLHASSFISLPPCLGGPGLGLRLLLRLRDVVFDPFERAQVRLPASHSYLPHRDAVSQADRSYPHPHLGADPQRPLALRGSDDTRLHVAREIVVHYLAEVE